MIKTTVKIDGMACGMCEAHINDAIRNAFPIKKVRSSFKKKETEIISEAPINEAELKSVIDKTGYSVIMISSDVYEKKGFSLFGK